MKFKEYIETNQVFTVEDICSVTSKASARTLLGRALAAGDVERVRRGVYVSKTGKFRGESPDPFQVLATVDPEAVVSYHSALIAHGVAHSAPSECSFRSKTVRTPFEYGFIRFTPYDDGDSPATQTIQASAYGTATVTTREQTILDCLARPSRAGGIEEAVRSCAAFPCIDPEALLALLEDAPAAVAARAGWLLDVKAADWCIPESALKATESLLGRGPVKLAPASKVTRGWNARWKLYLPEEENEVLSWALHASRHSDRMPQKGGEHDRL
jgi:predicted transcriptional regulator of viral defense system